MMVLQPDTVENPMKKLYLIVTGAGIVVTAPFLIWLFWWDMVQAYRLASKDVTRMYGELKDIHADKVSPNRVFDPGSDFWEFVSVQGGSSN
ncbi:MAG: hypothetical protein KJN71_09355 [Acidimicrobiia bacterium]|nr:hypothetical protein [Acidimicrobiia bacterium]